MTTIEELPAVTQWAIRRMRQREYQQESSMSDLEYRWREDFLGFDDLHPTRFQ